MIAIFVGYLIITMGIGLWQAQKTKSQSDFVLGGSQLPGWMLALSERATGESAWAKRGLGKGSLIFADGPLVVLSDKGTLVLVEATPGAYNEKLNVPSDRSECIQIKKQGTEYDSRKL